MIEDKEKIWKKFRNWLHETRIQNYKKFIKPWKRLGHWLYETWIILVLFGLIFYFIYKIWLIKLISGIHISDKCLTYMFSTGTGDGHHFQWIGISTILAVVAFIFNAIWNKKNFNADIKSKSRIDWMKTVRKLISEYVIYARLTYKETKKLNIKLIDENSNEADIDEISNKLNDYLVKYQLSKAQLKLYISVAKDNEELNNKISNVDITLNKMRKKISNPDSIKTLNIFEMYKTEKDKLLAKYNDIDDDELDNVINTLMNTAQNYFYSEWKRSKRGE